MIAALFEAVMTAAIPLAAVAAADVVCRAFGRTEEP